MRQTAEQILSFLDKANEIRDIHEVLPSDDPEAAMKAIVEVFYERFAPDHWISTDTPPPIDEKYGESKDFLAYNESLNIFCIATYNEDGDWSDSSSRSVVNPSHYRELPDAP